MGLRRRIVGCSLCPRLVEYRAMVKPRASFASQVYWRKPVPGFGDMNGRLLIVGLAPASSGAFRTGRIFTGDASSSFLVSALHSTGFANQPVSDSVDDGLVYKDCYLTAAVKCAPPGDKPTAEEFANCSQYLDAEIALLPNLRLVLTLGAMAFDAYVGHLRRKGADVSTLKFGHGKVYRFKTMPTLYASYHPSPRNTNTGKLTRRMLVRVLARIRKQLAQGGTESRSVRFW
jgi:uracil-DNA glycosylase family 4